MGDGVFAQLQQFILQLDSVAVRVSGVLAFARVTHYCAKLDLQVGHAQRESGVLRVTPGGRDLGEEWCREPGVAMRRKVIVNVYTIASYLQDGVAAKSAEQLAAADGVKMMHLVMERDVAGRDMADAIQAGVRLNYPSDAFAAELKKVADVLGALDLRKRDHVTLTALPRVGLRCQVVGKTDVTIENSAFAKAVWDIYLGKQNIGEAVKTGLTSRL